MSNTFAKHCFITKQNIQNILTPLFEGESVTSLWLPKSSKTMFGLYLQNHTKEVHTVMKQKDKQSLYFVFVDLAQSKETVQAQICSGLHISNNAGALREKIGKITKKHTLVFVVDNFSFRNKDALQYILSFEYVNPKHVLFLFLSLQSSFAELTNINRESFGPAFLNLVTVPYYNQSEALKLLDILAKKHKVDLNKTQCKKIVAYCGGIFYLLENLVRRCKKYPSLQKAINSTEMQHSLRYVWQSFSNAEQKVLSFITKHNTLPKNFDAFEYLQEQRLVSAKSEIIGTWIRDIVTSDTKNITQKDNSLFWKEKDLNEVFTNKEYSVFRALFNTAGTILSREAIASVLWGDDFRKEYSDWAIDQVISRIRKKLDLLGIGSDTIQTVRGKGITFKK